MGAVGKSLKKRISAKQYHKLYFHLEPDPPACKKRGIRLGNREEGKRPKSSAFFSPQ